MATAKTLYEILGVANDATPNDIGVAYDKRRAELQGGASHDPGTLALLHEAHEVLCNAKRRAAYDASLITRAERAAAAQQAKSPDLVLEPEEQPERARLGARGYVLLALGVAIALGGMYFGMRAPRTAPPAAAEAPPAPVQPAPPPAPQVRSAADILATASSAGGALLGYEMSGAMRPIGVALSTEPGTVLTTCHGIPAGMKLVVRLGAESLPADLAITDESLDLCKLSVAGLRARPLAVAPEEAKAGDRIFLVGADAAAKLAVAEGKVSALRETPAGKVLELSVPMLPASSGGGVFDEYGRLVGIATAPHRFGTGDVALPASWIAQVRTRARAP